MTRFNSFCRTSGLVLTSLGMLALVLMGGSFSHAHEIAPAGHDHHRAHDQSDGLAHNHYGDKTQGDSDGSLHCGAPILTLVSQQITLSVRDKERVTGNLIGDLIPRVLYPEPPPPRIA